MLDLEELGKPADDGDRQSRESVANAVGPPGETVNEPGSLEAPQEPNLAALRTELEQFRDLALRARAELDNAQRRHRREIESAHRYGPEGLVGQILPVVDSLETALSLVTADTTADDATGLIAQLVEGTRLTLNMLVKALASEGVTAIDPLGEAFDPGLHQAITLQPSAEVPPNHVLRVFQKGYRLHDRLVRPAMVIVASEPVEPGERAQVS